MTHKKRRAERRFLLVVHAIRCLAVVVDVANEAARRPKQSNALIF
jgi:hypothetical protein